MRNISNIFKITLILILLAFACASHFGRRRAAVDIRTIGENQFRPLNFAGDDAIITGKHPERALNTETIKTDSLMDRALQTRVDSSGQEEQTIFRVQIYTTKLMDDAQQYSESVKLLFPEGVFVEYQMPYYKVRVGEFRNFADGQVFLNKVKQLGFENAWLVRIIR